MKYHCGHIIIVIVISRRKYELIDGLHSHFPGIPLMALTATATPQVKQILSVLRNPTQVLASVNKPNMSLPVMKLRPLQEGTYNILRFQKSH